MTAPTTTWTLIGMTAVAVLCLAAAVMKLRAGHLRKDLAQRSLGLSLGSIGAGLVVFEPPMYKGLDSLTGAGNLSALAGQLLVLVAALYARVFLLRLTGTDAAVWPRWLGLAVAAAAMSAAFAAEPVKEYSPVTFTAEYAAARGVPLYWTAFLAYLIYNLGGVVRLSLRYAAMSEQRLMRRGLVLVACGTGFGIAYFAHWGLWLLMMRSGTSIPPGWDLAMRQLLVVSNTLILLGVTLPGLGQQLATRKAYWQLYPLWRDITAAAPGVVLEPARNPLSTRFALRRGPERLYRRVIEIRDGRLALRDRLEESAAQRAREAATADANRLDVAAETEAAMLHSAIHNVEQPMVSSAEGSAEVAASEETVEDEVQWLARVARAYAPLAESVRSGSRDRSAAA